jgi:quinoprotein relay system zinc metallohydrolase 2
MRTLLMALCAAVAAWSSIRAGAAEPFAVTELAPGVFVHAGKQLALDAPGHDDIANLGFVVGARCVAVIDTGGSVRTGRALRAAIRERTPLPVCYVIDTHVHVDHVLGNAAFHDDHPKFVGHAQLPAALARSRALFVRDYAADLDAPASADQIIAPDLLVTGTLDLDLGGRVLKLKAWDKAHTDCDLSVFDVSSRTLFAGDLLFRERIPALDGSARGWLEAIEVLEAMEASHVVPGHGPAGDDLHAAFAPERRYLRTLIDEVRAAISAGKSIGDAAAQVTAGGRSGWLLWDTAHAHNVTRAYQELEWE